MSELNVNIPRFYCLVRKEFLYNLERGHGTFMKACVFGVASLAGRAIGFHVLLDNGAVMFRLPIHALCHKIDAPATPLDWLQMWDCFGYEVSCIVFDQLKDSRVEVVMKDKSWREGQYLFTLDWYGNNDSEEAGDGGHKCAHVIALDEGNFAAQPNNRIKWKAPHFVEPFKEKPDFITNTHAWSVGSGPEWGTDPGHFDLHAKGLNS
jgi:hypothetical protein